VAAQVDCTPVVANVSAPVIRNLDDCRVGWELINHDRYTYYGKRRAVVVQFSRGCPHRCNYCGQHNFWRTWRHRNPVAFAAELARLHREQGVELINFADENPTASRTAWQEFLEALIAQNVALTLIGTTRASDIVRDADILHLYKKAGVARFLLGLESTDDATLQAIHKGSTKAIDRDAIQLMRKHGIISMAAWVAGFVQEKDSDYWRTLRQLLLYDPDQIQALYATPHRWTPFAVQQGKHRVVQTDLSRWDYKHQVLESSHVPNWRVVTWVKSIEAICQLRPQSLFRLLAHPDPNVSSGMRWYLNIGRRVWIYEIWQWLFWDRRTRFGPTLAEFLKGGRKRRVEIGGPKLKAFVPVQPVPREAPNNDHLNLPGHSVSAYVASRLQKRRANEKQMTDTNANFCQYAGSYCLHLQIAVTPKSFLRCDAAMECKDRFWSSE
jgi:anaerobic magnesium-protoporphyrin IX monomethyl ester cyclase